MLEVERVLLTWGGVFSRLLGPGDVGQGAESGDVPVFRAHNNGVCMIRTCVSTEVASLASVSAE